MTDTPKWSRQLLDMSPITVECRYEQANIDWAAIMARKGTVTVNGVAIPVEIKNVGQVDGEVGAELVFTPEDYERFTNAIKEQECPSKNLKLN